MHKIQLNPDFVERSRGHRGRVRAFHRIDPGKTVHLIVDMQKWVCRARGRGRDPARA